MNKLIRPAIIALSVIFLVLACTVVAFSAKAPLLNNTVGAAFMAQVQETPTPSVEVEKEDNSEVGSTDEIVIMGGVIALIVLLPLLFRREAWIKNGKT